MKYDVTTVCNPGSYFNGKSCVSANAKITSLKCAVTQFFNGKSCTYNPVYAKANPEESLSLSGIVGALSSSAAQVLTAEKPDCGAGTYWFAPGNACLTQP